MNALFYILGIMTGIGVSTTQLLLLMDHEAKEDLKIVMKRSSASIIDPRDPLDTIDLT